MSEEERKDQTPESEGKKGKRKHPHIEINEIDSGKKASLANRLIVSAILIVVFVPAIFLGGWWWFGVMAAVLLIATFEFTSAPHKKYNVVIYIATYAIVLGYAYWYLVKYNVQAYNMNPDSWSFALESFYGGLYISIYGIITSLAFYCFSSIVFRKSGFDWADASYLFMMTLLVGLGFQAMLFCRYWPYISFQKSHIDAGAEFNFWHSTIFIIFVLFGAIMNDTMAYFVGMLFGKRKLCPEVSPKKTVEGFIGGWVLGGALTMGFAMIVDACGYPILDSMRIFGEKSQWWYPLIMSFTLPLVGDLGDLTFSVIKRHYGFKDYGKMLGAMGGVLDRLDSMLFCCIYASTFAVFTANAWNFFA